MNSKNAFDVQFFKLLINSIYGKSMENIRKRMNVKLINNSKDCSSSYNICVDIK